MIDELKLTDTQKKFLARAREYGLDLDFENYVITRGWGWSKRDGSCGSHILSKDKRFVYLLFYPLRNYINKNVEWDIGEIGRNTFIIELKRSDKQC